MAALRGFDATLPKKKNKPLKLGNHNARHRQGLSPEGVRPSGALATTS